MLSRRFLLYLLVGGMNTLVGYGMFSLFIFAGMHYAMATVVATIMSVLFNFKSTGKIVFRNDNNQLFFRFILVYIAVCLFNIAFLRFYSVFDDNMYFAGVLVILPSAVVSFLSLKRFVFNGSTDTDPRRTTSKQRIVR